jgi:hypothetical protein
MTSHSVVDLLAWILRYLQATLTLDPVLVASSWLSAWEWQPLSFGWCQLSEDFGKNLIDDNFKPPHVSTLVQEGLEFLVAVSPYGCERSGYGMHEKCVDWPPSE